MTETRAHDEIEIERVAENLYNDALSRSRNPYALTWDAAYPETKAGFVAKAQRVLEGDLHLPAEGVMHKPLLEIDVEHIPHTISVLMARWTQVTGSIPPLPGENSSDQQSAETVDYTGPLQEVDIVLMPEPEGPGETFAEIETPNGYSVNVGTRTVDPATGYSRIRIRVPVVDIDEPSRERIRRHG